MVHKDNMNINTTVLHLDGWFKETYMPTLGDGINQNDTLVAKSSQQYEQKKIKIKNDVDELYNKIQNIEKDLENLNNTHL
jgi:hypothetical protein